MKMSEQLPHLPLDRLSLSRPAQQLASPCRTDYRTKPRDHRLYHSLQFRQPDRACREQQLRQDLRDRLQEVGANLLST
jgi:hypothetical protein